jgi:beta-lactamase regulating signal transducer with metallopeptidase domain
MSIELTREFGLASGILLSTTLKSALLLALAGGLALTLKRAAAATRHYLWFAALTGVLCLPVVSFLPAWQPPIWAAPVSQGVERLNQVAISIAGNAQSPSQPVGLTPVHAAGSSLTGLANGSMEQASQTSPSSLPRIFVTLWMAGVLAWAARWLLGRLQLRRIARLAQPSDNSQWSELLKRYANQMGVRRSVQLLVAQGSVMPMTWGWRSPIVLLPAQAEAWPVERLELVLRHELAHIRRRDYLTQNIAGLACALQWFNPLAWHAAHRMRAERELACDDLVLSSGARPSTYAGHLFDIALQFRNQPVSASLPMARPGELEQRLRAVLAEHQRRGGLPRTFAVIMAAMVAVLVCFVGAGARSAAFKSSFEAKNNLPPRLKEFFVEKEKQARILEVKAQETNPAEFGGLPTNVWAFFAAGAQADWPTVTNAYAELRAERDAGGRSIHRPAFQPIMEAYGAYEQFTLMGEKYAQSFTRDIVDSLPAHAVYFGGTDPGRFLITAAVRSQANGDPCFVLTQNALADGTYLEYLRVAYNDKLAIPTGNDSQRCFQEYLQGAQQRMKEGKLKPGENVTVKDNRVQVGGQTAVMEINGLLAKVIFDKNPDREFYTEESWPLDWMYPHLTPNGLILKLNRQPLAALDEEIIRPDQQYWTGRVEVMIGGWLRPDTSVRDVCDFSTRVFGQGNLNGFKGDPGFVRNQYSCAPYAKARAAIASVYQWRMEHSDAAAVKERMAAAADFAYRQSFALCPYSPEAASRYARFLIVQGRLADAKLIKDTAMSLKPEGEFGEQLEKALNELERHN